MTGRAVVLAAVLFTLACAPPRGPGESGPPTGRETVALESPTGGLLMIDLYRDEGITTGHIDAPIGDVWQEMAELFAGVGLPSGDLTVYDPAARRIGAGGVRTRRLAGERLSRFLECGGGLGSPKVDNGQARISLESWLEPDGDATLVHSRLDGVARDVGTSTAPIRCTSNGRLERELLVRLEGRLLAGGTS